MLSDDGQSNGRIDDPLAVAQMGIFTLLQLMIDSQLVQFRYRGRRSIEELLAKRAVLRQASLVTARQEGKWTNQDCVAECCQEIMYRFIRTTCK
jgi:hypothetical protein